MEQTMSAYCSGILGLFITHPKTYVFMTDELITLTVCVLLFPGAHHWPVPKTSAHREQPLPHCAEDD